MELNLSGNRINNLKAFVKAKFNKMINLCIGININSWNVSENNQSINYLKSHYKNFKLYYTK